MAILRKSTKLEGQDPGILVLKGRLPTINAGCFDLTPGGTPAHDPEQPEAEPMPDIPPERPDHRPKDWYVRQCDYDNYIGMLQLNSQPLNKETIEEIVEKQRNAD